MGCCVLSTDLSQSAVERLVKSVSATWPGSIPEVEMKELLALEPCQALAILNIRRKCAGLNREFGPVLLTRADDLGFTIEDVRATLRYIREEAPLLIHLDIEKYGERLLLDSHYRNMFETTVAADNIHTTSRLAWEDKLFGRAYREAEPFHRCKYGVLNVTNDPLGVRCCTPMYGSSYLLLKGVRLRTTFSAEDSAELEASQLATVDAYAHVLSRYVDTELRAALEVGTKQRLGVTSLTILAYKEAQIHGEIRLKDHVELVMAHPWVTDRGKELSERLAVHCNAPLVWMDANDEAEAEEDAAQRQLVDDPEAAEAHLLNTVLEASLHDQ
mmetsp:Transcript_82326/g.163351  ORF Transcript_82326/g.163351 Transcript_82326/m.163351 type:complete len:329 (+) Transcript_82326:97-1083(+)